MTPVPDDVLLAHKKAPSPLATGQSQSGSACRGVARHRIASGLEEIDANLVGDKQIRRGVVLPACMH